ncbi:hypothetical protein EEAAV_10185 [Rahnella aceris]
MSELLTEKFKIITTHMLNEFLNDKGILLICRTCGRAAFSIVEIGPSAGSMRAGDSLDQYVNIYKNESLYEAGLPQFYLAFTCKNCGTSIHINPEVVLNWHKQNQQLDRGSNNG